ncbi:hypothetical protein PMIN06_008572 [Paraphaeosphaeria minitans]|uniref:Uncharacterized protein n=1 Tax=Paraphaeosphaeria minitans TaxID=565426 RepID=A0A9P6GIK3_9PLEO|nr:hypothetical protein PMIN01_07050 [Paraphaeosphaeria minitans]
MASRTVLFSLGLLLLSARATGATPRAEDVVFKAYGEGYGYQSDTSPSPSLEPAAAATPDGGYGYGPGISSPDSTPTLPPITTPTPYAPSSSPTCTNSTANVTIPWSTATPSASHTCHNTTITSTIYASISTPSVSPTRNCSKTTTTVTIPWPGTGTGYTPSGANGGWNGTTTHFAPTQGTNPPPSPTPVDSKSTFELPGTSSEAVQSSNTVQDGGETPTPTPAPEPAPSGNTLPAPPASTTGPEEPLFTGGAARYGSEVGLAVAVGALVACW